MHDTKLRRSTHLCIVVPKESFIDLLSLIHPSFVCYTANFSSTMIRHTAAPSAHPFDATIDLSSQERDSTLINSSQTRRQSNPRHSRRSDRRGTMGSLSSNSTGGGVKSVESSEDAFASDLMALADQAEVNTASTINVPAENNASIFLDRQLSSLTIDDGSTNSEGTNGEPLLIRKVQSQLLDKHIRSGRISSVATSIDLRGGRSRDQLVNSAAGQRRIRTTLSFGTNIGHLAYESQGSSMPRAMSRNDSWKVEGRANTANKSTNKAAVSAGRALLGR